MQTKFTWEGFENREFCVDFKNDADKMHFLKECEKRGYEWFSGKKPTEISMCSNYAAAGMDGKKLKHSATLAKIIYTPHPIDCSIAENYLKESDRMCKFYNALCKGCPIESTRKEVGSCRQWNIENPQQSIEIVQAWSDEHPIEPVVTRQDKFLEIYPDALIRQDGVLEIRPCVIDSRFSDKCPTGSCANCGKDYWSQLYKENDK